MNERKSKASTKAQTKAKNKLTPMSLMRPPYSLMLPTLRKKMNNSSSKMPFAG
jgi:hypothetical protein